MGNARQGDILAGVRREIVEGKYPPGSKLPTRDELQRRFGASRQTVQAAMNVLIRDGFVVTNRSGGTLVAEAPPHLTRYGLVSGIPFSESRLNMAVQRAALKVEESLGTVEFSSYCYEGGHIQSEGFRRLVSDVEHQRVAGLIFITPPSHLDVTPVIQQPGIPRVSINGPDALFQLPSIHFSYPIFMERAVRRLISDGRRKIALLGTYLSRESMEEEMDLLVKKGVGRPMWVQDCSAQHPWSAHQAALLMMALPAKDRPDGIIIRDDHLVETATGGLLRSGVRVPEDVAVVAHCNFPDRYPSSVPVERLGLDCTDLLRRCLESLAAQREGRMVPRNTPMPVVFESEIERIGIHPDLNINRKKHRKRKGGK